MARTELLLDWRFAMLSRIALIVAALLVPYGGLSSQEVATPRELSLLQKRIEGYVDAKLSGLSSPYGSMFANAVLVERKGQTIHVALFTPLGRYPQSAYTCDAVSGFVADDIEGIVTVEVSLGLKARSLELVVYWWSPAFAWSPDPDRLLPVVELMGDGSVMCHQN